MLVTLATGGVLLARAGTGVIAWEETAEIPLMSLLMVLMVWHAQRRQSALAAVTLMAARERELAQDRERLTRLTSHEMRTPLTIARGYVEMLLAGDPDEARRRDLAVVDDELDRLTRVTERLVRAIRLQGDADVEQVDLDLVLHQTAERWAPVAQRRWVVDAHAGPLRRLRGADACEPGHADRERPALHRHRGRHPTDRLPGPRRRSRSVSPTPAPASARRRSRPSTARTTSLRGPRGTPCPRPGSDSGWSAGWWRPAVASWLAGTAPEGGALLLMQFPVSAPVGPLLGVGADGATAGLVAPRGSASRGDVLLLP